MIITANITLQNWIGYDFANNGWLISYLIVGKKTMFRRTYWLPTSNIYIFTIYDKVTFTNFCHKKASRTWERFMQNCECTLNKNYHVKKYVTRFVWNLEHLDTRHGQQSSIYKLIKKSSLPLIQVTIFQKLLHIVQI